MMITDIDDYFQKGCGRCNRFDTPECSTNRWAQGLAVLRQICLDAGLTETVKWGQPCYTLGDRNVVIFGAYREEYRLTFFNGSLMKDPDGLFEVRGPNTQQADIIRFTDNGQAAAMKPVLLAYLSEAIGYTEKGIKPAKRTMELVLPTELVDALDSDPDLAEAFGVLTKGRQRSYVINLNGAKKSETRVSRIAGFRDKIIAGKGALDR